MNVIEFFNEGRLTHDQQGPVIVRNGFNCQEHKFPDEDSMMDYISKMPFDYYMVSDGWKTEPTMAKQELIKKR